MNFVLNFSLIFDFIVICLAFYFLYTRIFFISLGLLIAKSTYLYTSIYQAHLINFTFLPLLFGLLCLSKENKIIFCKENLINFLCLIVFMFISIFLSKNTNFLSEISKVKIINLSIFTPLSEFGFIIFSIMAFLVLARCIKSMQHYLLLAYILAFVQFLYTRLSLCSYFEFASFVFFVYLIFKLYKAFFYDEMTKLPNQKMLRYYLKNKENFVIALLHFNEFDYVQTAYKRLILRQLGKVLRKFKTKIFVSDDDFVLVFENQNKALKHLAFLESLLRNKEFSIEDEKFKLDFKIVWSNNTKELTQSLKDLKQRL
ncbi:hypothetical protein FMM56_07390 [Campylobacter sp. LR264d]|uniref:hypothetical protein n=1 Tax=Campylobacter sp. LR264d TaxID=2593544 RepID=UPI001239023E|nr:hypothetical protein [Campylobacter sp. LR264d]KAA6229848.1 hypothetical protein FMM56_07390 [Campylobacter sp. LR264d]